MAKKRYVRVYDSLFDHAVFKGPLCERSAWLWLITAARFEDQPGGGLKRGQLLGGRSFLAKQWGWSEQNVRTFLKRLVAANMVKIDQSTNQPAQVITVCNYDKFQATKDKANQTVNHQLTSDQPAPNQRLTTLEEGKKEEGKKEEIPTIVEQDAAREDERTSEYRTCKEAFNGSTESMLDEVAKHMQGDRAAAEKWLASTLGANGHEAVSRAYSMLIEASAKRERPAMVLPWWGKTARTLKANAPQTKPTASAKPPPPDPAEVARRKREFEAELVRLGT